MQRCKALGQQFILLVLCATVICFCPPEVQYVTSTTLSVGGSVVKPTIPTYGVLRTGYSYGGKSRPAAPGSLIGIICPACQHPFLVISGR